MGLPPRLRAELRAVGLTTLFFATWFFLLLLLKRLILAEYDIEYRDMTFALIGALIVAKVVLVLENVPLESWIRARPALVHVAVRTGLYGAAILIVLLLERSLEARHEYGGFLPAVVQVVRTQDINHVVAATIGVTGALLVFNGFSVIRLTLGDGGLLRLFLAPLPENADLASGDEPEPHGS